MTTPAAPAPATLGELRASGHQYKEIKQELRDNLLTKLAGGEERFPGIVGFDETVLPELERALLAGHDVDLLDEWTPAVAGCEVNDHPYAPICVSCRRRVAAEGDDLEIVWRHRSERYGEKLATPDTSVGDLIGDVDPIKVAECHTPADTETVHYGLVPRTNRGIFSVNELPDLAERIQVALLNVLEERDIQVRGYQLRLPLDLPAAVPTSLGKVEFDELEEGRELELLKHLLRRAVAETFRARLTGQDLSGLLRRFDEGETVESGELVSAPELLQRIGPVPGLAQLLRRLGDAETETPGLAAAALEFAMEGLHLGKRLGKEELPGRAVYGR